jgi:hypothetical protein
MSPAQLRAKEAEAMAFERAQRAPSRGEELKARQAAFSAHVVKVATWCGDAMPDLMTPAGGPCSYAIQAALDVRRTRPELKGDGFVREVRAYRGWLMRNVPVEDVVLPGEDSDERVAA